MKDIIGQEIVVGNHVAFNPPHFKGLVIGKVIRLTPKGVRIEYNHCMTRGTVECNRYRDDVIKVDEQIMFMNKLSGNL